MIIQFSYCGFSVDHCGCAIIVLQLVADTFLSADYSGHVAWVCQIVIVTMFQTDVSLDRQYTDNKGVDLEAFFKTTLNKSHSDRMMLLKLEQEMISFIKDDG